MICKVDKFPGNTKLFRLVRMRDKCKESGKNLLTLSNKVAIKFSTGRC